MQVPPLIQIHKLLTYTVNTIFLVSVPHGSKKLKQVNCRPIFTVVEKALRKNQKITGACEAMKCHDAN